LSRAGGGRFFRLGEGSRPRGEEKRKDLDHSRKTRTFDQKLLTLYSPSAKKKGGPRLRVKRAEGRKRTGQGGTEVRRIRLLAENLALLFIFEEGGPPGKGAGSLGERRPGRGKTPFAS